MSTDLAEVYDRYADFTVVPRVHYQGTLELATHAPASGAIVECGVWRGGMIAGIAEVLGDRDYVLCDSFAGLPEPTAFDGPRTAAWYAANGRMDNAPERHAALAMDTALAHNPAIDPERIAIVAGWFADTLPQLDLPEGIALLRLDADFHAATATCLDQLFPCVVDGGLIIVDDYYFLDGCAQALHQYLVDWVRTERIETHGDWRLGAGVAFLRKGRNWT